MRTITINVPDYQADIIATVEDTLKHSGSWAISRFDMTHNSWEPMTVTIELRPHQDREEQA